LRIVRFASFRLFCEIKFEAKNLNPTPTADTQKYLGIPLRSDPNFALNCLTKNLGIQMKIFTQSFDYPEKRSKRERKSGESRGGK
jgi:hypothetical protein